MQNKPQSPNSNNSVEYETGTAKPYVNRVNILASKKYNSVFTTNNLIKTGGDQILDPH